MPSSNLVKRLLASMFVELMLYGYLVSWSKAKPDRVQVGVDLGATVWTSAYFNDMNPVVIETSNATSTWGAFVNEVMNHGGRSSPEFDPDLVHTLLVEALQNVKTTAEQAQVLHGRDVAIMGVSVPRSVYGWVLEAGPRAFKVLEPDLHVDSRCLVTTADRAVGYTYPPDSCARFRIPAPDSMHDILIFERTADVRQLLHAEIYLGSFLGPSSQVVNDFGEAVVNAVRALLQYQPSASTAGCTVMLAGMLSSQEVTQIKDSLEKVRLGLSANVKFTGEDYSRTAAKGAACIARMALHYDPDCPDSFGCDGLFLVDAPPLPTREL